MKSKYLALALVAVLGIAALIYRQFVAPDGGPTGESERKAATGTVEGALSQASPKRDSAESAEEREEQRAAERIEAIQAMEGAGDSKTIAALEKALADPNSEVKEAALEALSERKGANVTAIIRRGLNDPDPDFRIEVLEALAERGDLESLRRAKSDPDEDVRERAAELLESAEK